MTHVTPACARPTKRFPQGRTGTSAGYLAHRAAKEEACRPCISGHSAKTAARKASLSPVFLERERKKSTQRAQLRRATTNACLVASPEHPDSRRGTLAGYSAHVTAGQWPCQPCRDAADAHDWQPVCSRPTANHPNGRTGTRAGFHAHKQAQEDGCEACLKGCAEAQAQRRKDDPDLSLRGYLWAKYRLSLEAYKAMLAAQGGACAICKVDAPTDIRTNRFHVDHDHACCPSSQKTCGKCVRALLCHGCNTALGNFKDDPVRLRAALSYLTSHKR